MLIDNSGDIRKAQSNHWFFDSSNHDVMIMPGITNSRNPSWRSFWSYFAFLGATFLTLYTQIAVVRPIHKAWHDVTMEAFGFQHIMTRNQHERLARKFHILATFDQFQGYQARVHAAHGIADSQRDYQNATAMYERARTAFELSKESKEDAAIHGDRAKEEHVLYLQYLQDASECEQRAEKLRTEADGLANQSDHFQKLANKFAAVVREDTDLEEAFFGNATHEGEVAVSVTEAEKEKEDNSWICKWAVVKKFLCGSLGGMTALGEAEEARKQEEDYYQKAVGLQNQIIVEKTEMMIALTKASRAEEDARLDYLKAEQSHNESLADQLQASQQHAMELQDLQKELEDMKQVQQEVHDLEYYQGLEVQLAIQARKENEYAHGQWELGTHLLHQAEAEEQRSKAESDLAAKEAAIQAELVRKASTLGRQLRLYSSIAAAYGLVAVAFFIMALVTTDSVSMVHQLKVAFAAVYMAVVRPWNGRHTEWEGQSISGDYQNRNCLRQISIWCHHGLIFLFVVGMQGGNLHSIFDLDSFLIRGEIVVRFALTASVIETMLFQALPHGAVLPTLTREYFRDVVIRFVASAFRFALQMMLFLVLCGEGSTWLFGSIAFLNSTFLFWALLLIATSMAHMWYIEFPHAWHLNRNNGDMTITASLDQVTIAFDSNGSVSTQNSWSHSKRMLDEERGKMATIAILPRGTFTNSETESLLSVSVSDAEVPVVSQESSTGTLAYSSIPLHATPGTALPSPALQRLYEVSIKNSFFETLAYVEALLLVGVLIVIGASLPNIAHH